MSYTLDTIRLLIAHDSQDDAEQLMNALRNAGKATRAELALSEDDVLKALKSGTWELILCRPEFGGTNYQAVLSHLHRLGKAVPLMVLVDELDGKVMREILEAGARGVAPVKDRDLMMLLIDRQVEYLRLRKELQHSQLALHQAEKRLSTLMDQSRDAIAYVVDGMHIHANDVYLEMFGYETSDDLAGVPIMDMVSAADHEKLKKLLRSRAQDESQTHDLECKGVNLDGKEFDASFVFSASTYDGEACTQIVIRAAQVDEGVLEQKLHEMSQIDQVTGLFNRNWFMEKVDDALAEAVRSGQMSTVLIVRVDEFERHQTDIGIDGADEMLKLVGEYLAASAGEGSHLARISGEDLGILKSVADLDEASDLAEVLRAGIEKLMPLVSSRTLHITASVGVSFAQEDSRSSQSIVTKALECCNKASSAKGNAIVVYNPMDDLEAGSAEAIALVLKQALEKGGLQLQYQPIMAMAEESGTHFFEVFVHLPQEDGSALSPSQFIPVAGELGLAGKIDRWVILNSIKAAAALGESVRLLINLNGYSLEDPGLAEWIAKALKAAKIGPAQVTFQFPESDLTNYMSLAKTFTDKLHQLGCRLSVNRFGGSIDPFKLLAQVNADMVKFDGTYTQDLGNKESKEKFAGLIGRAKESNKEVLVGFVESANQMQALWTLTGVDYLQGYYLQPPSATLQLSEGE
ncbi:MAG: EAL domain-containing protein [Gammaproteobacteria bacterium]|nr:EAL domain-containing protein [Gammaproteobacteria bacterium]MBQ0775025.1 EAL domain-containing protein [Gammaproteobacteria bacterium]